jgi:hypothetical protein
MSSFIFGRRLSSMKVQAGAAPPWKARTTLPAPTT